jgi:hypothetical protein
MVEVYKEHTDPQTPLQTETSQIDMLLFRNHFQLQRNSDKPHLLSFLPKTHPELELPDFLSSRPFLTTQITGDWRSEGRTPNLKATNIEADRNPKTCSQRQKKG